MCWANHAGIKLANAAYGFAAEQMVTVRAGFGSGLFSVLSSRAALFPNPVEVYNCLPATTDKALLPQVASNVKMHTSKFRGGVDVAEGVRRRDNHVDVTLLCCLHCLCVAARQQPEITPTTPHQVTDAANTAKLLELAELEEKDLLLVRWHGDVSFPAFYVNRLHLTNPRRTRCVLPDCTVSSRHASSLHRLLVWTGAQGCSGVSLSSWPLWANALLLLDRSMPSGEVDRAGGAQDLNLSRH